MMLLAGSDRCDEVTLFKGSSCKKLELGCYGNLAVTSFHFAMVCKVYRAHDMLIMHTTVNVQTSTPFVF